MTRWWQNLFYKACEVMYAWSCMDVFVVSIMAAILEISQFAVFMVGDKCDFIQPIIEKYFKEILGDYDSCFEVVAVLAQGSWILFPAVIFYTIVANVYMRVCQNALEARAKAGIPEKQSTAAESSEVSDPSLSSISRL